MKAWEISVRPVSYLLSFYCISSLEITYEFLYFSKKYFKNVWKKNVFHKVLKLLSAVRRSKMY